MRSNSLKVLIVDDSPISIKLMSESIQSLCRVFVASDGQQALSLVQRETPDLLLLDIQMPNINGFEVCKAIKQNPELQHIAIMFVTADTHPDSELAGLGLGGIDYITKPINRDILHTRVRSQLTAIKRTRELIDARDELSRLIARLPVFVSHWTKELVNTYCNDTHGHWFGLKAEQMSELFLSALFSEAEYSHIKKNIDAVLSGKSSVTELDFNPAKGSKKYVQLSFIAKQSLERIEGFMLVITDITERKSTELRLKDDNERFDVTLKSIGDGVIATDLEGRITFINPVAESLLACDAMAVKGLRIEDVMPLYDSFTQEKVINPIRQAIKQEQTVEMPLDTQLVNQQKEILDIEDSAAPITDKAGNIVGAILVFHDVTQVKAATAKMVRLATHDSLTNLPNRVLLLDRAEQEIKKASRDNTQCCLLMLDIDAFESINNTHGYLIGDQLLVKIGERLQGYITEGDTLGRPGSDEFTILLSNVSDASYVDAYCTGLLNLMKGEWTVDELSFNLTASIGAAIYPFDGLDAHTLYRRADTAMRDSKRKGKNDFRFFSEQIEQSLKAEFHDSRRLRKAIENDEIKVYYQPKVDGVTGQMVGCEALIRWHTENGEVVYPDQFIPLAERTKLIIPLGAQILKTACEQLAQWHELAPDMSVSVNISAIQFTPSLLETVKHVLDISKIPPHTLELEISESTLINDKHAVKTVTDLKSLGVKLSMDDFGKGYSSLSYIKKFPVDVLKIDQSFVLAMLDDKVDMSICETVINLANNLGLELVAEGVETAEHAKQLLKMNCRVFQGYLYSKAVMPEALTPKLRQDLRQID